MRLFLDKHPCNIRDVNGVLQRLSKELDFKKFFELVMYHLMDTYTYSTHIIYTLLLLIYLYLVL